MTKQEAAKLIYVIKASYPKVYDKCSPQDFENMIAAWVMVMEDYAYDVAAAGLMAYLANDTKGFPPSPGQVIDCIHKIGRKDEMSALEAWQYVSKAIKNGIYHSQEEFEKLPEICKKVVGRHENIREWATMDSDTVQSVEQSHFIRVYDSMIQRERENAKIPAQVRQMIEGATRRMIE